MCDETRSIEQKKLLGKGRIVWLSRKTYNPHKIILLLVVFEHTGLPSYDLVAREPRALVDRRSTTFKLVHWP